MTGNNIESSHSRGNVFRRLFSTSVCLSLVAVLGSHSIAPAESAPDRGLAATLSSIERLPVVASALHIVAHPDDENGALLAYLSRGLHARTALLTATRGEGGQNLLGPERAEAMGLLRTGEALAAARYYGVEQYFTRAYDFGFSKTAEETLQKWGREETLSDIVRVIREVRPDIVISRFEGTPRDGHGHHQAIGILTREAFRIAGNPTRFPGQIADGLGAWQPMKLYLDRSWSRDQKSNDSALVIDLGAFNPVLGYSYHELGILGLNQHRCQGMTARVAAKGTRPATFTLLENVGSNATEESSFSDGIDTSITGIAERFPKEVEHDIDISADLAEVERHAIGALERFSWHSPEASLPEVLRGLEGLRRVIRKVESSNLDKRTKSELLFFLQWKERDFENAAHRLTAVEIEALADDAEVVRGQTFRLKVTAYNRGKVPLREGRLSLEVPAGWRVQGPNHESIALQGGQDAAFEFTVHVVEEAAYSRLYYFRPTGNDGAYILREGKYNTLPCAPPPVNVRFAYTVDGVSLEMSKPGTASLPDRAKGIEYREVRVVPAVSVKLEPEVAVVPAETNEQTREWRAAITNYATGPVRGTIELILPPAWRSDPDEHSFQCSRESETAVASFSVTIPQDAQEGEARVRAVARAGDTEFDLDQQVVAYPHISTRFLYHPAESRVQVADLEVAPGLLVGYILGTQDRVPEALEQMGVDFQLLGVDDLAFGDLGRFDCIIAGVRAYASRNDLREHNQRLLEYVRNGGVYVVQYNKSYDWEPTDFAPYPADYVGHDRITVEESPVEILVPDHPLFNLPNRITESDFEGWVQERGLYFWSEWDSHYQPLLSGHDPNEKPKKGGMLIARYGDGFYIYTAYSWFRQLPAGVPGVYRLFANLISLARTLSAPPRTSE